MFKLGKLLFGLAVAGVTAATVYNYLDEGNKSEEDFENDLSEGEEEEEEDPTERLKVAASRTYTTIKAGSADARPLTRSRMLLLIPLCASRISSRKRRPGSMRK